MEYVDDPYDTFSGHRDVPAHARESIDKRNWRLNMQLTQYITRNEKKRKDGSEFCPDTYGGFQHKMGEELPAFEGDKILTAGGIVITTVTGFVVIDPATGQEKTLDIH